MRHTLALWAGWKLEHRTDRQYVYTRVLYPSGAGSQWYTSVTDETDAEFFDVMLPKFEQDENAALSLLRALPHSWKVRLEWIHPVWIAQIYNDDMMFGSEHETLPLAICRVLVKWVTGVKK